MSTIYVFDQEISSVDAIATTDKFLIHDASTGRKETALASDVAGFVLGTTASSKTGFFGATATSAATTIAALTTTVTASATCGFASTAAIGSIITAINSLTQALKDIGIVKT